MAGETSAGRPVLSTRGDVEAALLTLAAPLERFRSDGGALVTVGDPGGRAWRRVDALEGFARPLWGVVPYVAAGGAFPWTHRYVEGLINGADPVHPEYWGVPRDYDQRLVEMAPIAFAILRAPHVFWHPLPPRARTALARWLAESNHREMYPNNWRFFRVIVNLALQSVGAPHDARVMETDLRTLEACYLGDGWYSDGLHGPSDYYVAFAMHFYALLYSEAAPDDAARCQRFREYADLFAADFMCWFSRSGPAVPYGRSLTYRFAQSAFWGAMAVWNPTLPAGVLKGLILRNLRWWFDRRISTDGGPLTLGYAYPNTQVTEQYNSAGSPYWAFKALLPLSLAASDPFWTSEEVDLPERRATVSLQHARMTVCREADHVFALAGGQPVSATLRHGPEKYNKFAYSTHFGFGVPSGSVRLEAAALDSALSLSTDGLHFRGRLHNERVERVATGWLCVWKPLPCVCIVTWLVPAVPWHVRVHRVVASSPLYSVEGGFGISNLDARTIALGTAAPDTAAPGVAVESEGGCSAIVDLVGGRVAVVVAQDPNVNVMEAYSSVPCLRARLPAGEHWLTCAAAGWPDRREARLTADDRPSVAILGERLVVSRAGATVAAIDVNRFAEPRMLDAPDPHGAPVLSAP